MAIIKFDQIDEKYIQYLIESQVQEDRHIEYKKEFSEEKFYACVSSFANESGGCVFLGVEERKDGNNNTGIPEKAIGIAEDNSDEFIRKLHQKINSHIDPQIPGVRIKSVGRYDNGPVYVIYIPKSYNSPHMVKYKSKTLPFYTRASAGNIPMDIYSLRQAFLLNETLYERINSFVKSRINAFENNDFPVRIGTGLRVFLFIIPLSAFTFDKNRDISGIEQYKPTMSAFNNGILYSHFNYLGYITYVGQPDAETYYQLYRNGIAEVFSDIYSSQNGDRKYFSATSLKKGLLETVKNYFKLSNNLDIQPPFIVQTYLTGTRGARLEEQDGPLLKKHIIDVDEIILPEIIIDSTDCDLAAILKPAFDVLWQSAGWPECME